MNCPKCGSRSGTVRYSKPRYRRMCFYCERCRDFRYAIEVEENILDVDSTLLIPLSSYRNRTSPIFYRTLGILGLADTPVIEEKKPLA